MEAINRARLANELGRMTNDEIICTLASTDDALTQELGVLVLRIRGMEISQAA